MYYTPNPRIAYKSNTKMLGKYRRLHQKEQELIRAERAGMSRKYREHLEDVIAALQQSLSR